MRVIKEGQKSEKENIKYCKSCGTKFAYVESDSKTDRDGKYVECPSCKTFIAVT